MEPSMRDTLGLTNPLVPIPPNIFTAARSDLYRLRPCQPSCREERRAAYTALIFVRDERLHRG